MTLAFPTPSTPLPHPPQSRMSRHSSFSPFLFFLLALAAFLSIASGSDYDCDCSYSMCDPTVMACLGPCCDDGYCSNAECPGSACCDDRDLRGWWANRNDDPCRDYGSDSLGCNSHESCIMCDGSCISSLEASTFGSGHASASCTKTLPLHHYGDPGSDVPSYDPANTPDDDGSLCLLDEYPIYLERISGSLSDRPFVFCSHRCDTDIWRTCTEDIPPHSTAVPFCAANWDFPPCALSCAPAGKIPSSEQEAADRRCGARNSAKCRASGNSGSNICVFDTSETTCTCDRPGGGGSGGANSYSCSDHSYGACASGEICYAYEPFKKGSWKDGCKTIPDASVKCKCAHPGSGSSGGKNGYKCDDGTDGFCASDETCFAYVFEKGDWSSGCAKEPQRY